ncbi:MAG: hypothetical protein AB8G14_07675 [Ilumatobacter sp.]
MKRSATGARVRWAAVGAAIAVSLGAGLGSGVLSTSAASNPNESTFVSVAPIRILDTRPADNVGLVGKFVSNVERDLQVTGAIDTADGTFENVPAGATGVVLNVTAVRPSAGGFISVNPAGTTGFSASSLNFLAGEVRPNAVTVPLSLDGKISIVYVANGGPADDVDVLVDLVGYTTRVGLLDTQRRLNTLEATSPARSVHEGFNTSRAVSASAQVLATVEIPYDQVGNVTLNASVTLENRDMAVAADAWCTITDTTTVGTQALGRQTIDPEEYATMSLTRGFEVSGSGTFTANLVCRAFSGAYFMSDPNITAVYVPVDPETLAGG